MAKKLIRIEKHPDCSKYDSNIDAGLHMAVLSNIQKTDDKGFDIRQRATGFSACREVLNLSIRAVVDPIDKKLAISTINQDIKDFDFEKLRLLLATVIVNDTDFDTYKKRLFAGKRALNLLEEHAGWTPKSIISTVICTDDCNKTHRYWLITGPKE